jgi:hypothetical protein
MERGIERGGTQFTRTQDDLLPCPLFSGAGGAVRQGKGSAIRPSPQLHTKPFTFSLPSKLLPGLRFSEGL